MVFMKNNELESLYEQGLDLLISLIETPSFSREEDHTAILIQEFFTSRRIKCHREINNVWAYNKFYDPDKPTILLNSHHDTVKVNPGYTREPFSADIEDGKLYGLGSNDAGGALVCLLSAFIHYYDRPNLPYNLCLLASAEEEISGKNGIEHALKHIGPLNFAVVGEPTKLDLAVAEKGLMVLDCTAQGVSGHAAREEGLNAIYEAFTDLLWFKNYDFEKESAFLGKVKMSVTMIHAGTQHNVVPSECSFVVDVRTTEQYTNTEVLEIIKKHTKCKVQARSTRLNPSGIDLNHPVVASAQSLGSKLYGSPTMSDQALLSVPSVKVGPGDSARSHTADEYIYLSELKDAVAYYINLLEPLLQESGS